jgi:hypothetical protein
MQPVTIIIIIAVALALWLLLREVNAWYWKTNHIIALLEQILQELRHSSNPSQRSREDDSRQWKCPQCQHMNPNSTYKCDQCGYNLV